MKTKLSTRIRNTPYLTSSKTELWNLLLEAADTIEFHETEVQRLEDRLEAANLRYVNLYENRQELIKDFRIGIILTVITIVTISSIIFYFVR